MKYIIIVFAIVVSFIGGTFLGSHFGYKKMDATIALVMSRQTIENTEFQISEFEKYLKEMELNKMEKVKGDIVKNLEHQKDIHGYASAFCIQNNCSKEHEAYLLGKMNLATLISK